MMMEQAAREREQSLMTAKDNIVEKARSLRS
jgi:hypothetical protein